MILPQDRYTSTEVDLKSNSFTCGNSISLQICGTRFSRCSTNAGARSDAFVIILEDAREAVIFGADAESGPISDILVFDLDGETVIFTQ